MSASSPLFSQPLPLYRAAITDALCQQATEQIVTLLRQIEVSMAQGKPTPVACRNAGISQQNYAMSC